MENWRVGKLEKNKTCLVWDINTYSLKVLLPKEKQKVKSTVIHEALASKQIKTYTLESLIGKLNDTSHVIPMAQYFSNRLHHLLKRWRTWGPKRIQLWNHQYFQLWIKFLQRVNTNGVSINNVVCVKPTVTLWSYAWEYGIWGYKNNGLAWRWRIISEWHSNSILNLLSFLSSAISIYITIQKLVQDSHILALTDSSSAPGWNNKKFSDPVNVESYDAIAWWLGWNLFSNK